MHRICSLVAAGLAAVALSGCPAPRKTFEPPRVFTLDGAAISAVRARALSGDPALQPALEALRQRAEKALAEPVAEIASKSRPYWARSGDPKDYISTSKFAWQDPGDPSKWIMIDGQPWGIIDANRFPNVLDSVALIADSGAWTPGDDEALKGWFREFNRWLVESPLGKAERAAKNNHGTFYDLILAAGADYTGDTETVREVLTAVGPVRLDGQIAADGSTPEETRRAESAMYTLWNLRGLADLAAMGARYGIDIWNYPDADNAKLKKAGEFLLPYAMGTAEWTFGKQQMNRTGPLGFFRAAAPVYRDPRFDEAVAVMVRASNLEGLAADGSTLLAPWPAGKEPWGNGQDRGNSR